MIRNRFSLLFEVNLVYYSTTKKIQFSLLFKTSQDDNMVLYIIFVFILGCFYVFW